MNTSLSILVVDDDKDLHNLFRYQLSGKEYTLDFAASLDEAIDAINRRFYPAALVDLRLNEDKEDTEGMQVLERFWELHEGSKTIVLSGYAEISMYDEFRKYEIFDYLSKEATGDQITALVDKAFYEGSREAQRIRANTIWEGTPFGFINGMLAREILISMGGGQMSELRQFLGNLCFPYVPWLQCLEKPIKINLDNKCVGYQTPFWSRALGKAVIVRFGRKDFFKETLKLAPIDKSVKFGLVQEPLFEMTSMHYEGIIYELMDADFVFFKRPAAKRTLEH